MNRTSRIAAIFTIAFALLGLAAPTGAETAPRAPAARQEAQCDLRDPNRSGHHEWGECFTVSASLSEAPALGEAATLSYTIRSAKERPDAEVTVELPNAMAFVELPDGAARTRPVRGRTPTVAATARRGFRADQARTFSAPVRAETAGSVEIVVRVSAPRPDGGVDAAEDRVFLTVGRSGARSKLGIDASTRSAAEAATGPIAPAPADARPHRPVPDPRTVPAAQARAADHASLTTVCMTGGWAYIDSEGVQRQSTNFSVRVLDDDTSSADDTLAFGFTNGIGAFNLCYDNTDVDEGGLVDAWLEFVASNSRWRIRNTPTSNTIWVFERGVVQDQAATVNVGNQRPTDSSLNRVVQAYDAINSFWNWLPSSCWDANDAAAACRQIVVNWTPTSTDGAYYSTTGNDVHLAAIDPDSRHTVIHEAAHAVMDDVYEDNYPSFTNCSPHFIEKYSSPGCAWSEGYAEWVPASVLQDPFYRFAAGGFVPLETPTWGTAGWDNSLGVEGRVAGAMIDLEDIQNEGIWDRHAEGGPPRPQWTTFINGSAPTYYVHFSIERTNMGFDVGDNARASVFQNTINPGFYDPLTPGTPLLRPTPVPHDFQVHTTEQRWSVVAMRASTAANNDMQLYGSRSDVGFLTASQEAAGVPDYIMIDSRRMPLGDYYPKMSSISGAGGYTVEFDQSGTSLFDGSWTVPMGVNDVVAVRDTLLEANVPTYFRAVPASGQNIELLLHSADPVWTSPIQPRNLAAQTGSQTGLGGAEAVSHQAPQIEMAGLTLLNKEGAGTVTVYRDTTAPTGSVVINGGAASTTNRTVTLTTTAADAQTGVDGIQVSVDGVLDTEPVQPLTATRSATLPAGAGTKTVLVRYRNRAGMSSQVYRDTITLANAPDLRVTALTNPPATRVDGTTFAVTDTTANNGTATAPASTTRYYLSVDKAKGTGDVLLTGSRAVSQIAVGASRSGTVTVRIPAGTQARTYYLLACADDGKVVPEANELNNCRASAATISVT